MFYFATPRKDLNMFTTKVNVISTRASFFDVIADDPLSVDYLSLQTRAPLLPS